MDTKRTDNEEKTDRDFQANQLEESSECMMTFADAVDWFCITQEALRSQLAVVNKLLL
jgi:hypothetical protein